MCDWASGEFGGEQGVNFREVFSHGISQTLIGYMEPSRPFIRWPHRGLQWTALDCTGLHARDVFRRDRLQQGFASHHVYWLPSRWVMCIEEDTVYCKAKYVIVATVDRGTLHANC